jgi:hypothetical protein
MLATVVRQFAPSRIEHQLLAQVFEFVVTVQHNGPPAAFDLFDDLQPNQAAGFSDASLSSLTARKAA